MPMEEKNKQTEGRRFLRWPWNLVVYLLLVLVLGLLAIPVILLLLWVQRRGNPHGAAEGYCLSRTRQRLWWLLWGVLLLLASAALGAVFFMGIGQDRTYWEAMDYVTLVVSGGGAALLLALGVYLGFVALRDSFFPEKSSLAQSIRQQLPYPEEAPPVEELFAMVDDDLRQHGQWFDAVGIGEEWVLGEVATRIDRIRGIFTVDEIHTHHRQNGGTTTSRTLQLVLVDNRWQRAVTSFKKPQELQAAADCLALRVPEAARGRNSQNLDFAGMDDIRQELFEREFQQKQSRRLSEQVQQDVLRGGPQPMILRQADGSVTSRLSTALVQEQLRRCLEGAGGFTLTPTRPVQAGEDSLRALECVLSGPQGSLSPQLLLVLHLGDPEARRGPVLTLAASPAQAEEVLRGWLRLQPPNLARWTRQQNAVGALPGRQG